jgi:hypothetical protein
MTFLDEKILRWSLALQILMFIVMFVTLISMNVRLGQLNSFEIPSGYKYYVVVDSGSMVEGYYAKEYSIQKPSIFISGIRKEGDEQHNKGMTDLNIRLKGTITIYNKYGRIVCKSYSSEIN